MSRIGKDAPVEVASTAAVEQTGDDRPTRYTEERDGETIVVYRASGLGACTRALVAMSQKYIAAPVGEFMQEVFDEGHEAEPLIRAAYEEQTENWVMNDQLEIELDLGEMHGRQVIVRGHIDGESCPPDDKGNPMLFEAKKFRESTWSKFLSQGVECNVNYPWQVSVYMHALDLDECDFVGGRVSFDDWNNMTLEEIHVKHLAQPPFSLGAIRKRIASIEKLIHQGFDAKEVECQRSMYPCPYFKLHDWDEENDAYQLPVDGDEGEVATLLLGNYALAASEVSRIGKLLKAAEDEKKRHADALRVLIEELRDPAAEAAKKLVNAEYELTHVRKEIAEHTRKASKQDYFTIKPIKAAK